MKKLLSLAMILIICVSLLASCGDDNAPDGMKLASSEAASYKLYVPEDWVLGTREAYTTANAKESKVPNVSATTYEFEDPTATLDEWWETEKEELKAGFGELKEISTADTVVDGVNAKEYVYSAKLGTMEYTYHQVAAMLDGGVVCIITYTSTPDTYEDNLPTFNKITEAFRF